MSTSTFLDQSKAKLTAEAAEESRQGVAGIQQVSDALARAGLPRKAEEGGMECHEALSFQTPVSLACLKPHLATCPSGPGFPGS